MKNLILTFVFALVSLVSFTQISYTINNNNINHDVELNQTEILLQHTDSIKFNLNSGWDMVETQSNFLTQVNTHNLQVNMNFTSASGSTDSDTVYIKFYNATSSLNIKVIFAESESVSTSENTLTREELKVYPSPATSDIKISFSADKSDMPLNIFSLNGQLVHQENTSREVGAITTIELNISGWLSGIYFVKVGNHTEKLIIE